LSGCEARGGRASNLRPFKTFQPFNRFATFKTLVVSQAGMRPAQRGKSKRRKRPVEFSFFVRCLPLDP
jgi:hypothetical protein